ncbi:response regulator, partial [Pseudomonas sp. GW531-E2]
MVPFAAAFVCPTLPVPDRGVATILVVEDEPTVCELAAEALLDEGYRVLTAADAWEAEAILSRESVDLLFTDIDLARNTDGLSLARCA